MVLDHIHNIINIICMCHMFLLMYPDQRLSLLCCFFLGGPFHPHMKLDYRFGPARCRNVPTLGWWTRRRWNDWSSASIMRLWSFWTRGQKGIFQANHQFWFVYRPILIDRSRHVIVACTFPWYVQYSCFGRPSCHACSNYLPIPFKMFFQFQFEIYDEFHEVMWCY